MTLTDYIALAAIALVIGGAIFYIIRAKKSGKSCVACPDSPNCSRCSGSCAGCTACHTAAKDGENDGED